MVKDRVERGREQEKGRATENTALEEKEREIMNALVSLKYGLKFPVVYENIYNRY